MSIEKLSPLGTPGASSQPAGRGGRGGQSPQLGFRYRVGDRVVVFTQKGDTIHGTVRWVGMYTFTVNKAEQSHKCVGIETVSQSFIQLVCSNNPCLRM